MSGFDLTAHSVLLVQAERVPSKTNRDWLQLTLLAERDEVFEINLFFGGPVADDAARIFAAAINEAADKVRALQLRVEAPSVVAEKCRAVAGEKS